MSRTRKGRGVFYTRDSGGKHEMTPGQYVAWAQTRAKELGVTFRGTPETIEQMIRAGTFRDGDVFLDYEVSGNALSRQALNALILEASEDVNISHLFIPRRDRLARPHDPMDGVKFENLFRAQGIAVVFTDRTVAGFEKGQRIDISELIMSIIDYDHAGKDRRDLAQKMVYTQISLAKAGFSTGGRAPFGFRRWLARDDGTPVRELAPKEYVRMAHHHVVWLPGPEDDMALIHRILSMLTTQPASRVAATLTREGIPSPDAGRTRKDQGIRHSISGDWHQNTVTNIARNPLLVAMTQYGVRSMCDQLRYTPTGPRELREDDFRPDEKPKVVRNPVEARTVAAAHFEPLVDAAAHRDLIAELDARGGTQRGKPRSRTPAQNPLGARIFDMNCCWPMYRQPYQNSFRYSCGRYQQSHGEQCAHNHVNGAVATQFGLSCIRQKLVSPSAMQKLKRRLAELTQQKKAIPSTARDLSGKRVALVQVSKDLERAASNMALAETPAQFKALSRVFDELTQRQAALKKEIQTLEVSTDAVRDTDAEVEAAMNLAERLVDIAKSNGMEYAGDIFRMTNLKLFFRFAPVPSGKRVLNKVTGGVVTLGDAAPPIEIYAGRTDRGSVKASGSVSRRGTEPAATHASPTRNQFGSGEEGDSLRNVNRDDRI